MMRRSICIFLVCVIVLGAAVPASAVEPVDDSYFYNVLDYGFPEGYSSNTFSSNLSVTVTYDLPYRTTVRYIDLYMNSNTVPTVEVYYGNAWTSLTVKNIDGELYHVYGPTTYAFYDQIKLRVTTGSLGYHQIFRCDVFSSLTDCVKLSASASVYATGIDGSRSLTVTPGIVADTFWTGASYSTAGNAFSLSLLTDDWYHYDYIDIVISADVGKINSISCIYDYGNVVPVTYNLIQTTSGAINNYYITARIDLTGISPNTSKMPTFYIDGQEIYDGQNSVFIYGVTGIVVLDPVEPDTFFLLNIWNSIKNGFADLGDWISAQTSSIKGFFDDLVTSIKSEFTSLKSTVSTWGQNIVNAINPDTPAADEAVDQGSEKADEVGGLTDKMNSVSKPDMSGGGDTSDIISTTDMTSYTVFLSTVLNAPYISQVVMLSLILSLAAYVLFGKR